jgi:outer membrane receptor protein involved in Fe transport
VYPENLAHLRIGARLTGALFASAVALAAQTTPPASPSASNREAKDETVVLDPFEVVSSSDTGFGASTTSLTRFNVDLAKLPATADILDHKFIEEVSVTTIEDLFKNYGAGSGFVLGTPESDSNSNQPGDYYGSGQYSIRGLSAGVPRRNGFNAPATSYNTTTTFDIEEVSVLRGSQGLLYGPAGAAGLVNLTTKLARFDRISGQVQERIDRYGSRRTMLDGGWGNHNVALRIATVFDRTSYRRDFINDRLEGY